MPTIFAHNSTSYRTSHLPKGLRRYEVIRSSASPCTTPPLTDTEVCHRPDPVKSLAAPPALHPEKSPLKSPSSLIQGEVQRDERVRPVGAKPLQNHLINPEILTKGGRRVVEYLAQPITYKSYVEFPGVGAKEFRLLDELVGEKGGVLAKPRLSYNFKTNLLIVEMPSVLHDTPFDYLKDCFHDAFASLPYDRYLIRPLIHMAWPLKIADQIVKPDMTISLTRSRGPTKFVSILSVAECALSERADHVFNKVQNEIDAHPEVLMAIIALIREATPYASPQINSAAWKELFADAAHQPLLLDEFVDKRSTPCVFGEPVTVAGHNWCYLDSVEYFVWIKNGEERIDISNDDPQHMARGSLFPSPQMDAVTRMMNKGLEKIRTKFVELSQELDGTTDLSALREAPLNLPVEWPLASLDVLRGTEVTSHARYDAWHVECSKGPKRLRDPDYEPSEHDAGSSSDLSSDLNAHGKRPKMT